MDKIIQFVVENWEMVATFVGLPALYPFLDKLIAKIGYKEKLHKTFDILYEKWDKWALAFKKKCQAAGNNTGIFLSSWFQQHSKVITFITQRLIEPFLVVVIDIFAGGIKRILMNVAEFISEYLLNISKGLRADNHDPQ